MISNSLWVLSLLVVMTSQAAADVSALCAAALKIDCAIDYIQQTDETLCATNGHTYVSLCFFSKAKCQQPDLNIQHFGACVTSSSSSIPPTTTSATPPSTQITTTTTTAEPATTHPTSPLLSPAAASTLSPSSSATITTTNGMAMSTTTVDEYEILRRVFCAPESQVNCQLFAYSPYCGSNSVIYNNECEFVKAQCSLDIKSQDMTFCSQDGSNHHHHSPHHHNPHDHTP